MNILGTNRTRVEAEAEPAPARAWAPGDGPESELARVSLHAIDREPERKLAWVNSVSLLILLIGVMGSRPASVRIQRLPPAEEATAAIVEPLPAPPPSKAAEQRQEPTSEETPDTPQVVVVTPEAPNISFAVPTIGNLVVPKALAQAPPLVPLKPVEPLRHLPPTALSPTGSGGERPQPPYPRIALEQGQQGSVILRMTVDAAGGIRNIEIAQTSGYPILDRSAQEFVRRRWTVPTGQGTRIYEATITYKLQIN